jgi:hypothetical protein
MESGNKIVCPQIELLQGRVAKGLQPTFWDNIFATHVSLFDTVWGLEYLQ